MAKDEVREEAQFIRGGLNFLMKQLCGLRPTGTEQTESLADVLYHLQKAEAELVTFIGQRLATE